MTAGSPPTGGLSDSGRTPPVALLLDVQGPARVGEPLPVTITVRNQSGAPIVLAGVLDGSEGARGRYPRYDVRIEHDGAVVAAPGPAEDPLVAPLRASELVTLAPGGSFDPTVGRGGAAWLPLSTLANFRPAVPGVYRVVISLDTAAPDHRSWFGRFNQQAHLAAVSPLLERVPAVTVEASVEIQVRPR